ncbi:MAG: GNAT family N-acetyltransferase [Holosporales bacterium]|jgi:GNAT superfamily N-acetyltransferase
MDIVPLAKKDFSIIWPLMKPIIRAGEAYALPRDMGFTAARAYWFSSTGHVFVALDGETVLGTYYWKPNRLGGGGHVANAGFMVNAAARGRGVAQALCQHALDQARQADFTAMQFNFVVSSNSAAVYVWKKMGFVEIGRIPCGFAHPTLGFVDVLILHRGL